MLDAFAYMKKFFMELMFSPQDISECKIIIEVPSQAHLNALMKKFYNDYYFSADAKTIHGILFEIRSKSS